MGKEYITYDYLKQNKDRTFQDALDYLAWNSKESEVRLLIKMYELVLVLRKALSPKYLKKQVEEGQRRLKEGYYDKAYKEHKKYHN